MPICQSALMFFGSDCQNLGELRARLVVVPGFHVERAEGFFDVAAIGQSFGEVLVGLDGLLVVLHHSACTGFDQVFLGGRELLG